MTAAIKLRKFTALLLALSWPAMAPASEAMKDIVVADVGFATPESVEYYADEDVYLVTNINGSPFAADGNGFISKVAPDGRVIDLKWIDGAKKGVTLHTPKGATIRGKNLFVADINQVHVFDLPSGKQRKSITVEGSTFLNGITAGAGDYVYVTDSGYNEGFTPNGTDAIYKVWASGKYELVIKDKEMAHPNGVWEDKDRLVVVPFGSDRVFSIDRRGKQTALGTAPNGGLDGLVKIKGGQFVMSSWGGSAIYAMSKDGQFRILLDSVDAPADIGVDTKRNRLLIPLFKQNKVLIHPF